MTDQHTPGPWRVDAKSYPGGNPPMTAYTVYELRGGPTVHAGDNREVNANARLIAAAPDLLAALEALTDTGRTFRNVPIEEQEWTTIDDDALDNAFDAIRKARGEDAQP